MIKKPKKLPLHIAIIMDGNGRWAQKKLLNRVIGHRKGMETVKDIVRFAKDIGVKYLTLYAFSIENWKRPKAEVAALMKLLEIFLTENREEILANGIRLKTIGRIEMLPMKVQNLLFKVIDESKKNDALELILALSYGSKTEITDAANAAFKKYLETGEIPDTEEFGKYLYTKDIPNPDFLIRTSGEHRLSNFLLWQLEGAIAYFPEVLWPDFSRDEFLKALNFYESAAGEKA